MKKNVIYIITIINNINMDAGLLELLRKVTTEDGDISTHITTYGPNKKWCVKDNEYMSFWYKYCELIHDFPNDNYCLAEQPKTHMPIIVDITLKFHPLGNSESYSYNFVLAIVYCYQQAILNLLNISEKCIELICCVLESEDCVEDNLIVSRIRLQFPYCKTLASVQNRIIRPYVLKMLRTENVLSRLNNGPVNDWENIIDPCTAEQPCIMYGSSVSNVIPRFQLEHIFYKIERDNIDTGNAHILELDDTFYFTNHELVLNGIIPLTMFNTKQDREFWLPMFFSLSYYNQIVTPSKSIPTSLSSSISISSSDRSSNTNRIISSSISDDTPETMAERFITMLGSNRIDETHFWLDVGKSLYNTFNGSDRGLELWIHFTQRSLNKDVEECEELYPGFSIENHLTYKTLAWYARQDSPDEFNRWHTEWYSIALEKAVSLAHEDIAEAFYRVYFLDFAVSMATMKGLYKFEKHTWKKVPNGHDIRKCLSGDFLSKYEKLRTGISHRVESSVDNNYKDSAEVLLKKISNLILKLKNGPFKRNIVNELLDKFQIDKFEDILDSNTDLLGMLNGIVEVREYDAIVRPGKPEDYISKTTGIIWKKDLHWNHPIVLQLMDWLTKVFPDADLLKYFGKIAGSCIKGRNSEKLFPILTGDGDNSKSMIKKLFEATFGSYSVTFPTTLFTAKQNAGGPTPETSQAKCARVAWLQEPDSDVSIKNGILKEQTGGDSFFTRGCNSDGGTIISTYKLFLMCNHVPIIPNSDKAVKNRTRIIPFLSTWVPNPPFSIDEQYKERLFKMDPHFERTIPKLAPAFMWYMVQMFGLYRKEGLTEPQIIKDHTAEYWVENDVYEQFKEERIQKAYKIVPENQESIIDDTAKITVTGMYSGYKDWFRTNYPSLKPVDKPLFTKEMSTRLKCKPFKGAWYGIKFLVDLCQI